LSAALSPFCKKNYAILKTLHLFINVSSSFIMNSIDEGGAKARNTPTLIEFKDLRFLIMDTPSDSSVPAFVQELQKYSADVVVRACDPTYGIELLKKAKIQVVVR
jgi:hypothetical protein